MLCCGFDLNTDRGKALAMMKAWDHEFGRVVDFLKAENLFDDSLVVLTSDNGGYRFAVSPARDVSGAKGSLSEGGIRVPFTASWPSVIPPNSSSDNILTANDVFPTIMGLLEQPLPQTDGEDMSEVFKAEGVEVEHTRVPFFQMRTTAWRRYDDESQSDEFAIRDGCMKMIKTSEEGGPFRLYNVCSDSRELADLAESQPVLASQMKRTLLERRRDTSRHSQYENVSDLQIIPNDIRLDIHQDDLTIHATIQPGYEDGNTYNLYSRGEGVNLSLSSTDSDLSRLTASITGIALENSSSTEVISLSADVPNDGVAHEVTFVIRGYLRGESSFQLFVDGIEKSKINGVVNSARAGESVYAVISENIEAFVGDVGIDLSDVAIYLTAIEPSEL